MVFVFQKLVAEITVPFTQNFISFCCLLTPSLRQNVRFLINQRDNDCKFGTTGKKPFPFDRESSDISVPKLSAKWKVPLPGMNLQ